MGEEIIKPLLNVHLLLAVLHGAFLVPAKAMPCCPKPALASRVHLHEIHIETHGGLLFGFIRMQRRCAILET